MGCGGGILTDAMARSGAHALGIDLATKSLKVAQLHALEAQTPNVQYSSKRFGESLKPVSNAQMKAPRASSARHIGR